jgi:capsular exopolysaccharide synthesis family protein
MTVSNIPMPLRDVPAVALPGPPRAVGDPGLADPEEGVDWHRAWRALLRFKRLIAWVTLAGTTAGIIAARFLKPQYLAEATIWVDEPDRRALDRGPIQPGQLLDAAGWVDLLRSHAVLDQVVRDRRMFLKPHSPDDDDALDAFAVAPQYRPGAYRFTVNETGTRYTLATANGVELERGAMGDSVGTRFGFQWAPALGRLPPDRQVQFSLVAAGDAARHLADALHVHMDMNGSFLRVELQGASPSGVAAVLNTVAERYTQVAADMKRQRFAELTRILSDQVQNAHQTLQGAEASLEDFQVRTITLPSSRSASAAPGVSGGGSGGGNGAQDPGLAGFFTIQLEQKRVGRDRDVLQSVLAHAADSGISGDALAAVESVQRSPEVSQVLQELTAKQADLRALRYRHTDEFPPLQRLVGEIATLQRETIPALVRALVADLTARSAQVGRGIEADSRTLREIPARAIEEARLRRAVDLAGSLYATLQQRYGEARLAEASTVPDVRILDSAVASQQPVKNTAPRLLLLAFCGSFGLAVMGALLRDRADTRVRYPDQVSRGMGLPILGAVPHLNVKGRRGRGNGAPPPEDIAAVLEGLRGVSLSLAYAHGTTVPLIVTITSPGAGDGKSFLTANLAVVFAEGGYPTLLIDGDTRRGVLHHRLGARRRPGLTDYLRGEVGVDAIVQATAYPLLTLIGCGTRASNAPELLGSQAMTHLIDSVRPNYRVILVDSPPLTAGVDPLILGTLTGSLALVLRTGQSDGAVAAAKLETLQQLPVRVLGAILNDVDSGAGYPYYAYYHDVPGYEAVDEHHGGSGRARGRPLLISGDDSADGT